MEGEENIFRAVKLNARTLTCATKESAEVSDKEDAPSVSNMSWLGYGTMTK